MNIPNPPETERVWLQALEEAYAKCLGNYKTTLQTDRALTPEELVAALDSLHAFDQYCSQYVPRADALSALGRDAPVRRLAQVRQDISQAIAVCSDMYRQRHRLPHELRDFATANRGGGDPETPENEYARAMGIRADEPDAESHQ